MNIEALKIEENGLFIDIDNTGNFKDFFVKGRILVQIDTEQKTIDLGGTQLSQTQSLLFAHFISQLLK
jgi:hypothetical protein